MAIILLYITDDKLRNLSRETYQGVASGITYIINVVKVYRICSIHIRATGQIEGTLDPVILILEDKYKPVLTHRLSGYGENCDWIVNEHGHILTSGIPTNSKYANEVAFTYLTAI